MHFSLHLNKKYLLLIALVIVAIMVSWIFLSKPLYPLVITTKDSTYPLRVELANTPKKLAKGLMFRTALTPDKGMLFIFPEQKKVTFWMKDTLIPLDMLFIKPDGKIDFIHHNAQPHDESMVESPTPVIAVLEIGGGQALKHGVKAGDIVKTNLLPQIPTGTTK